MIRKRLATIGVLAGALAAATLNSVPAAATTTQTSSCVDGGGTTWTVRSAWGGEYTNAAGVKVVTNDLTSFSTSAAAATTVDYSVKTYSGEGSLLQTLGQEDRAFDFANGTSYLGRNPINPPTAPGKARIVVRLGDGNDGYGNCSVTFVQPVGASTSPVSSMPVGDLPGWHQIFADDFTADAPLGSWLTTYGGRWRAYPEPWRDTSKRGMYSPGKVLSASNGLLDMYIHSENGQPYVAAPEPKINGSGARGQTYGRYSVKFRVPTALPGYKTAWLLWPDSNNSAEGELDFPEGNLSAGSTIHAYAHDVNGVHSHNAFAANSNQTYTSWHIATIEWRPTGVTYFLDGVNLGTAPLSGTPKTPMHWILQTETALGGDAPLASTAGHVQVDWVTAYQKVYS